MTKQPGYLKVHKELKRKIIKGDYSVGDLLPSENKLADYYRLSRMTVRHALKDLENEGLISRRQGKGSIVEKTQNSIALLSLKGFTEIMKGKEIDISTVFIQKPELKEWSTNFYWELETKEQKAGSIHFSRVRTMKEKAIMYEDTYLTNLHLPKFCKTPFVNNSFFDTLTVNHDIEITDVSQNFRAISASNELSIKLNIKKGSPVLQIIRKLSTNKPDLFVYSFAYCNTNEFTYGT